MKRKWKETVSPKFMHETFGIYNGTWMPDMDRCWSSDDGYQVTSRILLTEIGKVEHICITTTNNIRNSENIVDALSRVTHDGSGDVAWRIKQEIKNELFGEDRIAIELFPQEDHLVDVSDCYHLWLLPKGFKMPFGIHPTKDKQCKVLNRGIPKDPTQLLRNTAEALGKDSSTINSSTVVNVLSTLRG